MSNVTSESSQQDESPQDGKVADEKEVATEEGGYAREKLKTDMIRMAVARSSGRSAKVSGV